MESLRVHRTRYKPHDKGLFVHHQIRMTDRRCRRADPGLDQELWLCFGSSCGGDPPLNVAPWAAAVGSREYSTQTA